MIKPRMASKVIIDKPYVPAVATDIRKTIKAEQRRLQQAAQAAAERTERIIYLGVRK